MNALTALRGLGYCVTADGDAVRLEFTGAGTPDPAAVRPLLAELRAGKAEALAYLEAEALPVMYRTEAEEEAWWAHVFAERGIADPPAPAAPPAWEGDAPTLQDVVDTALAGDVLPAGWPEQYAAFWARNPRPAVSYAAALAGLEAHIRDARGSGG
jgi:hypothetical protein